MWSVGLSNVNIACKLTMTKDNVNERPVPSQDTCQENSQHSPCPNKAHNCFTLLITLLSFPKIHIYLVVIIKSGRLLFIAHYH